MEPGMTVTTGTLGVALSQFRQARTRAREEDDRVEPAGEWWDQLPQELGGTKTE